MKLRNQENGNGETTSEEKPSSSSIHLTDEDREKGNFKNFNLSKKTIKKLKGKYSKIQNDK